MIYLDDIYEYCDKEFYNRTMSTNGTCQKNEAFLVKFPYACEDLLDCFCDDFCDDIGDAGLYNYVAIISRYIAITEIVFVILYAFIIRNHKLANDSVSRLFLDLFKCMNWSGKCSYY